MAEEINNVTDPNQTGESVVKTDNAPDPAQPAGEPVAASTEANTDENKDDKKYEELEQKFGVQGQELGDLKKFVDDLTPFLNKLESQPEIIQAVMEGKITPDLLKSVSEGKITTKEAETVSEAHKTVKEKLGDKKYEGSSSEEIQKLVQDEAGKIADKKIDKFKTDFSREYNEKAELKTFEEGLSKFIEKTPDFAEYADAVNKFIDAHPDIMDIEVAYKAVKGEVLEKKMQELNKDNDVDASKNLAANAAGGASQSNTIAEDSNIVDDLIAPTSNRNVL